MTPLAAEQLSSRPWAAGLLGLCSRAREPQLRRRAPPLRSAHLRARVPQKRPLPEKPHPAAREEPLPAAVRESPCRNKDPAQPKIINKHPQEAFGSARRYLRKKMDAIRSSMINCQMNSLGYKCYRVEEKKNTGRLHNPRNMQ